MTLTRQHAVNLPREEQEEEDQETSDQVKSESELWDLDLNERDPAFAGITVEDADLPSRISGSDSQSSEQIGPIPLRRANAAVLNPISMTRQASSFDDTLRSGLP